MGRFYIDEIVPAVPDEVEDAERNQRWAAEREKFGFDSRDTWALDHTMTKLLYERLCLYLEKASEVIHLDSYKFMFEGEEYTREQLIHMMIDCGKTFLDLEYRWLMEDNDPTIEELVASEKVAYEAKQRMWQIWAICQHVMGW